jgi:hypothetical protein
MIVEALEQAQRLQTSGPEEGALALASDLELTRALSRGLGRSLVPQPDSLDPAGDAPPPSGGDAFS